MEPDDEYNDSTLAEDVENLFFQAIASVDVETVKNILNFRKNTVSAVRIDVDKALCESAKYGSTCIVSLLLNSRPPPDLRYTDEKGRRALHYAASAGPAGMVHELIRAGAVVNWADSDGLHPIHFAVQTGNCDVIETLINRGAHVNTPKIYNDGETALHLAARRGQYDAVDALLRFGNPDVNVKTPKQKGGYTPLHKAVQNCNNRVVRLLLENGADVNSVDTEGWSPLHMAAEYGNVAGVKMLLASHADVNVFGVQGKTPLHCAVYNDHTDIVEILISAGADVNAQGLEYPPLHCAIITKRLRIVELLLSAGADVNATSHHKNETSLLLASSVGVPQIVEQLIKRGANINVCDSEGATPLHRAQTTRVRNRNDCRHAVVNLLLENGAQLNSKDCQGYTPLQCCVFQCVLRNFNINAMKSLVQSGARLVHHDSSYRCSPPRKSPLCWLVWQGYLEAAEYLVKAGWDLRHEVWMHLPGKSEEQSKFHHMLQELARQPQSLKTHCRFSVRNHILDCCQDKQTLTAISSLPLPSTIKNYLKLCDID